jgi:hypothetical protein
MPPAHGETRVPTERAPVKPGGDQPVALARPRPSREDAPDGDQPAMAAGTLVLGGLTSGVLMALRLRRPGQGG